MTSILILFWLKNNLNNGGQDGNGMNTKISMKQKSQFRSNQYKEELKDDTIIKIASKN